MRRIARPGVPRRTVRLRLTMLYGALFLISGAGLLAITYALVSAAPPVPIATRSPAPLSGQGSHPAAQTRGRLLDPFAAHQHTAELHQLLERSGIALLIMAAVSILLGWIMAGRVLRSLQSMTLTTRTISADNLHQRLALPGPRDELTDLGDTIDGLLARLEAAFDAHRNFAANASHELRTPLTLTRALVQMRLRDPNATPEDFRATCEDILAASDQQERVIESLLVLARSQQGLDHREPLDLAAVTSEVVDDLQPAAAARQIQLGLTTEPGFVFGDSDLIERLITNLLENAIRHNTEGGSVEVLVQLHEERPELRVTNTGSYVAPEAVPRLLEPFHRAAPNHTSQADRGLGLGLSIVDAIVHAHHATLHIQSQSDGGLDITISFPQPPTDQRRLAAPRDSSRLQTRTASAPTGDDSYSTDPNVSLTSTIRS